MRTPMIEIVPESGEEGSARTEANIPSIAVFPFVDLSTSQDQRYFCDGIAEEILNALVRWRPGSGR